MVQLVWVKTPVNLEQCSAVTVPLYWIFSGPVPAISALIRILETVFACVSCQPTTLRPFKTNRGNKQIFLSKWRNHFSDLWASRNPWWHFRSLSRKPTKRWPLLRRCLANGFGVQERKPFTKPGFRLARRTSESLQAMSLHMSA